MVINKSAVGVNQVSESRNLLVRLLVSVLDAAALDDLDRVAVRIPSESQPFHGAAVSLAGRFQQQHTCRA